jgi:hypothetical protein
VGVVALVPVAEPVRDTVGMQGHHAGARMQRQMQRGDVAEAQQRLGIGPHGIQIDQIEIAQRQPAAGQCEDGSDLRIPQQTVELLGYLWGRRGRPPPPPVQVDQRGNVDSEAHPLDRLDAALEQRRLTLLQAAGQCRHRDDVARPHGLRTHDRWQRQGPPFWGRHPTTLTGPRETV